MPTFSLPRRHLSWIASLALLLASVSATIFLWPSHAAPKVLRVGADNAPPFHTIQPDGSIKGLAVDILNEAARRKNIRLIWVPVTLGTLDDALAKGIVDVWPALSRTPRRDKFLHFSKPWLESKYCLLWRKEAGVSRSNMAGVSLAVADSPRLTALATEFLPKSRRVTVRGNLAAVLAVCKGEVAAGFLDARTLDSVLMDRPEGCGMVPLHAEFVPEAHNPVSLAGRPEVAELIDELRSGISPLITNGVFSAALDRWSGFSGALNRSYFELREAEVRGNTYSYAVILLLVAGVLLVRQIWKQRAAQRRAEVALAAAADSESRFEAFMDHSPMVTFVKDDQGRLLYANRRLREMLEPTLGTLIGKNDFEIWPQEIAAKIRKDDLKILAENQSAETVDMLPQEHGEIKTCLNMKFPFRMGGKTYLGGVSFDITDRERAKEAMRISEERFRTAFANAAIGMVVADSTGRFVEVNPAFCEITGYTPEELTRMDVLSITHPDDRQANVEISQETQERGASSYRIEKRYIRKDTSTVWVRNSVGIIRDASNQPAYLIALVEDITIEKQADEAALLSEERWQLALQGTTDGIWDWDARNDTVFFSARWKEMLGFEDADVPNRLEVWEHLLHPQDREYARSAVAAHLEKRTSYYQAEFRLRCKDGGYKWILARGKAIWDVSGTPVRLIGTHTDITERKDAEEQLLYQANHDALTGLVNRRYFLSRLDEEIIYAHATGEPLCLCLCDIDHFKGINDREGHRSGDDVLVTFANILREGVRKPDLAGRMGGDEFYMLFPRTTAANAVIGMDRVRNRLQTIAFSGNTSSVYGVTASFGVAELASANSAAELIEAADRALYAAKDLGRNLVHTDCAQAVLR